MSVKQISIFLENKKGKLAEATRYIADHQVNLKSLCLADSQDFGILRIICENPEKVQEILRNEGYITTTTDVLATVVPDEPGSFAAIMETLTDANVEVEYTYAFLSTKGGAYLIIRVADNMTAAAALAGAGFTLVNETDLF